MARGTQQRYTDEDFESLEGRASRTEQKAVQRMAALGEQLANSTKTNSKTSCR